MKLFFLFFVPATTSLSTSSSSTATAFFASLYGGLSDVKKEYKVEWRVKAFLTVIIKDGKYYAYKSWGCLSCAENSQRRRGDDDGK